MTIFTEVQPVWTAEPRGAPPLRVSATGEAEVQTSLWREQAMPGASDLTKSQETDLLPHSEKKLRIASLCHSQRFALRHIRQLHTW